MKVNIIGFPSFSGALYSGTESSPSAIRDAGLIDLLIKEGITVEDFGDIEIPSYLPRHNVAPIRNWPSPRIVWEEITHRSREIFELDSFTLILGGDCSIVTGSINGLYNLYGDRIHLLCVDAHLDAMKPSSEQCLGAAGMGLWFLCNDNMFYNKPSGFDGSHISLFANQQSYNDTYGISLYSLNHLRSQGIKPTVSNVLSSIPEDAKIFIHVDLDSIIKNELYSVYAPSDDGLSIHEIKELLSHILSDHRIIGMEIAEFSAIRDLDGSEALKVAKLLSEVLAIKK